MRPAAAAPWANDHIVPPARLARLRRDADPKAVVEAASAAGEAAHRDAVVAQREIERRERLAQQTETGRSPNLQGAEPSGGSDGTHPGAEPSADGSDGTLPGADARAGGAESGCVVVGVLRAGRVRAAAVLRRGQSAARRAPQAGVDRRSVGRRPCRTLVNVRRLGRTGREGRTSHTGCQGKGGDFERGNSPANRTIAHIIPL